MAHLSLSSAPLGRERVKIEPRSRGRARVRRPLAAGSARLEWPWENREETKVCTRARAHLPSGEISLINRGEEGEGRHSRANFKSFPERETFAAKTPSGHCDDQPWRQKRRR